MANICEAFEKLPSFATMQKLLSSLISKAIPLKSIWLPAPVCIENLTRVDDVMESPKLAE